MFLYYRKKFLSRPTHSTQTSPVIDSSHRRIILVDIQLRKIQFLEISLSICTVETLI